MGKSVPCRGDGEPRGLRDVLNTSTDGEWCLSYRRMRMDCRCGISDWAAEDPDLGLFPVYVFLCPSDEVIQPMAPSTL